MPANATPRRGFFYSLSIAAATVPFAFALIRAVTTGHDFRYFWVASGSLLGAVATSAILDALRKRPASFAMASAIFIVSTLAAILAALIIGTRFGVGILVVGAAFGFWLAVAGVLYRFGRSRSV